MTNEVIEGDEWAAYGAPGVGSDDAGEPFGEDLPCTLWVGAKEAAHM